ncbi:MAG TPA: DUF2600 family protein [Solirubrobacteraceae bacterium]|jgi:tetraprenyl-beta-curcumene synthase|nr:DUF2600 family protein [Solirubrobacteraceae bacterium]
MFFSLKQIRAVLLAAARQLLWGFPAAARELRVWRMLARMVPDAPLRDDALSSLTQKRTNIDGATIFALLARDRDRELMRMLVAYEIMCDFLDSTGEHAAFAGVENGRRLHLALVEALDPYRPMSAYYQHHPWQDDGGYLGTLVRTCRAGCEAMPSYGSVRPHLLRAAALTQVQGLIHAPDPDRREELLRRWAQPELSRHRGLSWFEISGAAAAWLTVLVLLALAADADSGDGYAMEAYSAYFPWVSLAATVLDSYVDAVEDAVSGAPIFVAHYADGALLERRAREIVRRATEEVRGLDDGPRHSVIVACMIALYLSKDSARVPAMRATTNSIASSAGPLTRTVLPALRILRSARAVQRSA